MKFKAGDKVSFLNDTGGGTVNRVDDKGLVYVLTDDGFEIPISGKELVFSRNFDFTERQEEPVRQLVKPDKAEEKKPVKQKAQAESKHELPVNVPEDAPVNLWLGFVPESAGPVFSSKIACYLVNDSPYYLYFTAGRKESGSMYFLTSGQIEPDTKAYVADFDQTSLSKISHLHIQLLFVAKGRYTKKAPVDTMADLNLVNFSKESYYRENDYFEEKAVLFNLGERGPGFARDMISIPEEVREIKTKIDTAQAKPKKKEPVSDTLEVDLHYDGENSQLTPGAILALQMSRFHAAIEEAISKSFRRVVIIHGFGQGTLKMQIRKELQEKYPGFIYQDASFKEYGFGATMVHLTIDKKQ
ncbi:MAG TPA: DUF2027 domain-containing protein [Bacteroidales bacterium]|nr:DUF2027 domain-containing protein [Bacteroidales bacterium]